MPTAPSRTRFAMTLVAALLAVGWVVSSAAAQPETKHADVVQTAVSTTALKPGAPAMAAVVLEIKPGFHAQSNKPFDENLVAFTADVEPADGVRPGKPIYPKSETKEYPALGKLSVYEGRVVVRVPLDVSAAAKPGDVTIKGKLNYQICDDKACFAPDSMPFTIAARIAGPGEEPTMANAELFQGYVPEAGGGKVGKPIDPAVRAAVDAALSVTALQPGKPAKLAVVVDVAPGFHAQANPATGSNIATAVELDPAAGLTFGPPAYPPGKQESYPGVGTLSVYGGRTIVLVPVEAKPGAAVGSEVKIAGRVMVQVCDDKGSCFLPRQIPFELTAKVAGSGDAAAAANEPELFAAAESQLAAPPPPAGGGKGPAAAAGDSSATALAGYSLPSVFGIAFLVGILFNVVPCVLPVLPLKAIGFYETAQHNRARSVSFGLVFSLGVMASFAVLGLLVVVLRWFAWGELFSNPYFSLALVVILVAMALNMFGLFTVNLPAGAYMFTPRHDTYVGNFLFGILTAALSTPCTFGLFVSVLGVALTQPAVVGLVLIVTVGAGMAFPYLLLSALPEVARRFPRSGPWAELVKQFMGFLLLAVAVFFAQGWIARVADQTVSYWVIFGVMAAGCAFLVARSVKYGKTFLAPTVAVTVALLIVVPSFFVARAFAVKPYQWQPYTPELLSDLRTNDQVVLVEFTAVWCANCHALEATVLNSKEIQRAVRDHGVQMVKADITDTDRPSYKYWKFDVKAVGVPLTLVYPAGSREPIQLFGMYSRDDLRTAIKQAASRQTAMR